MQGARRSDMLRFPLLSPKGDGVPVEAPVRTGLDLGHDLRLLHTVRAAPVADDAPGGLGIAPDCKIASTKAPRGAIAARESCDQPSEAPALKN
jgi:hypothetical protein